MVHLPDQVDKVSVNQEFYGFTTFSLKLIVSRSIKPAHRRAKFSYILCFKQLVYIFSILPV